MADRQQDPDYIDGDFVVLQDPDSAGWFVAVLVDRRDTEAEARRAATDYRQRTALIALHSRRSSPKAQPEGAQK